MKSKQKPSIVVRMNRGDVSTVKRMIFLTWSVLLTKDHLTVSEQAFADATRDIYFRIGKAVEEAGWAPALESGSPDV